MFSRKIYKYIPKSSHITLLNKQKHQVYYFSTKKIDFNDTKNVFKSKSTFDIIKALAVFKICQVKFIVKNANKLLTISRNILGDKVTGIIVKNTIFKHFCAGEGISELNQLYKKINSYGVGGILDYAAEADINNTNDNDNDNDEGSLPNNDQESFQSARVYSYKDEERCDFHTQIFLDCIKSVYKVVPEGFAAIKVTALCNPHLLKRLNMALAEINNLFKVFSHNNDTITRDQFIQAYDHYFITTNGIKEIEEIFDNFDTNKTGYIDIFEWTKQFDLLHLSSIVKKCKNKGPLYYSALTKDENQLFQALLKRLDIIISFAQSLNIRVMIDAEQTYYQHAIDNLVHNLQKKFNQSSPPIVYTTYQTYLKDSYHKISSHLKQAQLQQYIFACKIVRGAYMISERKLAKKLNYPSPIHNTYHDTNENFNSILQLLIQQKAMNNSSIEFLIASHNQHSIEKAIELMDQYAIKKDDGIYFGQLLGMSDHLTFGLGQAGYKSYKYLPYGPVLEVVPYLIRRLEENSDLLGGVGKETKLLTLELKRRIGL